ncbi:hypothetical protein BKA67DRAFT_531181 [Truncatella angustata]|uniref:C2H2-type domain-containing protein n=1 Tax=Truncatella angustata TaxID=152316 RepID=A0A9P8UZ92_9PEZI|nr:uncharacterized protein BKA67DRAFT_531181 [Truncatella angustata]KAH6661108.1 hypothetical protein BKA67DRAFT_531181 [Truncatella angustata]KAH8197017.1 hypothetical protein TruAng_008804 [Truncatella angustata]
MAFGTNNNHEMNIYSFCEKLPQKFAKDHAQELDGCDIFAYGGTRKTSVSDYGGFGKLVMREVVQGVQDVQDVEVIQTVVKFKCHRPNVKDPGEICGSEIKCAGVNILNHDLKIHGPNSAYTRDNTAVKGVTYDCQECTGKYSTEHSLIQHIRAAHLRRNVIGEEKEY